RHAPEHFRRSFLREREKQNSSRIDPLVEQVTHTISQRARLSRARASNHKDRARRRSNRCELLLIELSGVIDMDRGRSWRALQRILTGHLIIADCKEPQQ